MFFLFALGSVLGYSIQAVLLMHHARRMDAMSLAFYRNISFVVTLSPLLFGASLSDIHAVLGQWPLLMAAGCIGMISLTSAFAAYRFVPAGIMSAGSTALSALLLIFFGRLFLAEHIGLFAFFSIVLIIVQTNWLAVQHVRLPHLDERAYIGFTHIAICALCQTANTFVLALLARRTDPLIAGYFWEVVIAIGVFAAIEARRRWNGRGIEKISFNAFMRIALYASPVLFGTGLGTLALRYGHVGIVGAIRLTGIVVIALLARWWYEEKLTRREWTLITGITSALLCLHAAVSL